MLRRLVFLNTTAAKALVLETFLEMDIGQRLDIDLDNLENMGNTRGV